MNRRVAALALVAALRLYPNANAGRSPQAQARDYETWLEHGENLREAGKDAAAESAFRKALAFPSGDYRAEAALARIEFERGSWKNASEFYLRALRKAPANYALCMQLAQVYGYMSRLDLAAGMYARAKKIDPRQAEAYIQEGYADLYAGQEKKAEKQFQSLIDIDTASPYGYHHMASYFEKRGDLAEAERLLRKALKLMNAQSSHHAPSRLPDTLHTIRNLAAILERQGRFEEAESFLRQGLSESAPLPPWHVKFLHALGLLEVSQGRRAQAEECFQQAAALYPAAELTGDQDIDFLEALKVGSYYSGLGDDAKAERAYGLLLSQRNRLLPTEHLRQAETGAAAIYRRAGNYTEASELYLDALQIAHLHRQRGAEISLALGLSWTRIEAWWSSF